VLVAGGVVVGLLAANTATDLRAMPQVDPRVPVLSSTGLAQAITADVLVGLGLVAVGTWAWMEFGRPFSERTDIAPGPDRRPERKERKEPRKPGDADWDPWASVPKAPPVEMHPFV